MTIANLIKPGLSLEADGVITIYEIKTGEIVAQYEGLEVHKQLHQAVIWKRERQILLEMTSMLDEHPEGYEGSCLCQECCSCSGEVPEGEE